MNPEQLRDTVCRAAVRLGFEACGVTNLAVSPESRVSLDDWLAKGRHCDMAYMSRQAPVRREPQTVWPEAQSAVVVLHNYYQSGANPPAGHGRIAQYALGDDYHVVMREKLKALGSVLVAAAGRGKTRVYVDAGPLPERELARRAGLGWIAKNTMLINPLIGSFTFIGVLLTDLDLAKDEPFEADRCGTCTRCLDACPTGAFPAPRVLDSARCISYLTIEAKGDIPALLRPSIGDWLFGCDVCQDVCPWNTRFASETREPRYRAHPADDRPSLEEVLHMDEAGFERAFGETALDRAGLAGIRRNARALLENTRQPAAR